jgi:uncharacterized protein (DUF1330 family)
VRPGACARNKGGNGGELQLPNCGGCTRQLCSGLGAGAVSVLHAQAKLPAYVVAEIDVKDQEGYAKDFLPKAQANIKEHGGKYLAGGRDKAISLSGSAPPNRVVLLQFPDMDALKAFNVKQGQLETDIGNKYASFRAVGIEGVEQK